mmetsp:Transcript_61146/g.145644  ORF Transcript_61146/g.145644 Transcript_61146/m.145644 type:complete len:94 (+) Transcript_61146:358-639(+)
MHGGAHELRLHHHLDGLRRLAISEQGLEMAGVDDIRGERRRGETYTFACAASLMSLTSSASLLRAIGWPTLAAAGCAVRLGAALFTACPLLHS